MPARLGAYPSAARAPVSQGTPAWLGGLAANRWLRAAAIVLLGCAAQEGCLHAVTWYLDDTWQVHDSEYVEGGLWWQDPAVLLTNLSYYVTWRLAGFSTVAFHLGNLGIHLALFTGWAAISSRSAGALRPRPGRRLRGSRPSCSRCIR
jgi:hypothetical protein